MNYLDELIELGLTKNEAKIYLALLIIKQGSVDNISKKSGVHRRNVYDTMQRLAEKGLISRLMSQKTLVYSPVHPDKLSDLVEEKAKLLKDSLPGLSQIFDQNPTPQQSYILKGVGGLKNYINLELSENAPIYGIGSKGSWFDPRLGGFAKQAAEKWNNLNKKSHLIFDAEVKDCPEVLNAIHGEYKFIPEKYSTGSSIDICGQYVLTYSGVSVKKLDQDISIFVLKDKTLAEDYIRWFYALWDLLPNPS